MAKIKKEKLRKRTNRKQNFKHFIESGYTDIPAFLNACDRDEDLLIYTCLKPEELKEVIEKLKIFDVLTPYIKEFVDNYSKMNDKEIQKLIDKIREPNVLESQMQYFMDNYAILTEDERKELFNYMKKFNSSDAQLDYLAENQPAMNETEERFNKCVESMAKFLKGYIEFNGFKMANAEGDAEDWSAEFWAKYCKICNFYRERWFHPEKFIDEETGQSKTKVTHEPKLYKEFIFMQRMSISSERKHLAFLATQNSNSSIFRLSLENPLESDKDSDKTLGDILQDDTNDSEAMTEHVSLEKVIDKALNLCKEYPDALERIDLIRDLYEKQNIEDHDKKTIILSKIFLYKAGLSSPKILAFIKSLSATYKSRYNISAARVNTQIQNLKKVNMGKTIKQKDTKQMNWRDLILHKRGEL